MADDQPHERHARKVRIGDVAAAAGVSVGTVSNVLNGRGNVSAKRRELVEKAIKDLSFSGSLLAKGMRNQRLPVVGLCVPNATSSNFVMMSDALEALTAEARYEMVQVITRHDPERERSRVERLIASRASGVMILPSASGDSLVARLVEEGVPTVTINHFGGSAPVDHVFVDHRSAFRMAARTLADGGYRDLIVVTQFPDFAVVKENIAGIREGVAESGRACGVDILRASQDKQVFRAALARRLSQATDRTAVIASSSLLAAWTLETLQEVGLNCSTDVGLLSAEEPDWALALTPELSCIQQPTRELARIAWEMLFDRIAGSDAPPRAVRCEASVNIRGSLRLGAD